MLLATINSGSIEHLLRSSTAPLILISGVGLVLMVVNARFIHLDGHLRALMANYIKAPHDTYLCSEIQIIRKRTTWVRNSMFALCSSIVSSSLLLITAIIQTLTSIDIVYLIVTFLIFSSTLVALSSIFLLIDVFISKRALDIELKALKFIE